MPTDFAMLGDEIGVISEFEELVAPLFKSLIACHDLSASFLTKKKGKCTEINFGKYFFNFYLFERGI